MSDEYEIHDVSCEGTPCTCAAVELDMLTELMTYMESAISRPGERCSRIVTVFFLDEGVGPQPVHSDFGPLQI